MSLQPQILGQRVAVVVKLHHGKNLSNVSVVTDLAHSPEQLGMAKRRFGEMAKVGVNQQTFIGTSHVLGNALRIQKRLHCSLDLEAAGTSPYEGERKANGGFLTRSSPGRPVSQQGWVQVGRTAIAWVVSVWVHVSRFV